MRKLSGPYLITLVALLSCTKPFDFDARSFEKLLVVDGLITDQPGPYAIRIAYTYPLDSELSEYVSGADVWVESGDGTLINYSWFEKGTYLAPDGFTGQPGQTYQLFIRLPDGNTFASSPEQLIASPPIDSIYHRYTTNLNEKADQGVGGIQFFLDSHDETAQARYFRYEWEDAYRIVVSYPESHVLAQVTDTIIVEGKDSVIVRPGIAEKDTVITECFVEKTSNNLIIGNTIGSGQNRMAEFPVRFVSEEDHTLAVRYAILVRQYSISESAYMYYKLLKENNESGGSLFDKQTGSFFGNIRSLTNSDQSAVGYFEVSGQSELRAFFSRADLDKRLDLPEVSCAGTLFIVENAEEVRNLYDSLLIQGHIFFNNDDAVPPEIGIQTKKPCALCDYYADPKRPDYWVD